MITQTTRTDSQTVAALNEADLRANTYSLLSRLIRVPPDAELLAELSNIDCETQPRSGLALCWHQLKLTAAHARVEALDDEFHDLFIGLGHGEVIPYGSWYQTGYLMDKPLARLRNDLKAMGIERQENVCEPEDHLAAVCECMALLINNDTDLTTQQQFFRDHLYGWLARCFADIEQAPSAQFYQSVAQLGQHFVELEARYLDVLDA